MREHTTILFEEISAGLPTDERVRRGAQFVFDCFNLKATEDGLKPFEPVQDPFAGSFSLSFPFPQLFHGKKYTILASENKIEYVNKETSPWQLTNIPVYDKEGNVESFSVTSPWHFVDLDKVWYLFSDNTVIMLDGVDVLEGNEPTVYCFKDIKINTGTEHNGRVVFGGFSNDGVWNNAWKVFLSNMMDSMNIPITAEFDQIDSSHIMWSSVGGGDFPMWLFFPERAFSGLSLLSALDGDYGDTDLKETHFYDTLRKNDFGFAKMPFDGEVKAIKTLGQRVIVYGETGVVGLMPQTTRDAEISTYAIIHLSRTGIYDKSCVGGDDMQHIFIDTSGALWAISGEFDIQRLGYRQFFSDAVGQPMAITKNVDTQRLEYYISTKEQGNYILANNGLTQHSQTINSVTFIDGGTVGVCSFVPEEEEALLVSNQTDLGIRGIKTITALNLSFQSDSVVDVAIDYRYKTSEEFTRSHFVVVNNEGNAVIRVAGVDFRVVVRAHGYYSFELDYIQVKWQSSDKRQIRGTHVAPQEHTEGG